MMRQMSIFDGEKPFKIDKPIRLITLFSGYDSQALALKYLGVPFEHYRTCEWAIPSIQALHDLHFSEDTTDYSHGMSKAELVEVLARYGISADYNQPLTADKIKRYGEEKLRTIYNNIKAAHNLVSICNAKGEDLGVCDTDKYCYVMTYSFPCFPSDSLVLTTSGYKKICNVEPGDMVLTHDNSFRKVERTFQNGVKPLLKIKTMCADEIKCTPNHKFWIRTEKRKGHKGERVFGKPYWQPAELLTKNDYVGVAVNQKAEIHEWNGVDFVWKDGRKTRHKNEISAMLGYYDFWYVIGRYMGDGWLRTQGGIVICSNENKLADLEKAVGKFWKYTTVKERTVSKVHIAAKELGKFCEQFGKGAASKHLTEMILDLPRDLLKAFLDGYMRADGYKKQGYNKICSTSRELILGIGQCVAKVYRVPFSIYKTKRPQKCKIEGREVRQRDTYDITWRDSDSGRREAFYEDGVIWCPVRKVIAEEPDFVYDIEVEENHSFTVQNVIVHNCQDLSNAGLQKGMDKGSGTRSGLLWEVERLLKESKELPQVLLMENVPQVIGKGNIKAFGEWVAVLDKLGYHSKWEVKSATDYCVPQTRKRCFMVSVQGNNFYPMPGKMKETRKLSDVLEDEVDKSYYLSEKQLEKYREQIERARAKGMNIKFEPIDGGGASENADDQPGEGIRKLCVGITRKRIGKPISAAKTLRARDGCGLSNREEMVGVIEWRHITE